jgi:hypothetical protein
MPDPVKLDIVDKDQMSLLGLMLGGVIGDNLSRPEGEALARKLKGALGVTAGRMSVTLRFDRGPVTMVRGLDQKLRSRVRGSLDGLLQVSLGRGAVRSFLAGEVSFKGSPLFALKALPLMRARPAGKRAVR